MAGRSKLQMLQKLLVKIVGLEKELGEKRKETKKLSKELVRMKRVDGKRIAALKYKITTRTDAKLIWLIKKNEANRRRKARVERKKHNKEKQALITEKERILEGREHEISVIKNANRKNREWLEKQQEATIRRICLKHAAKKNDLEEQLQKISKDTKAHKEAYFNELKEKENQIESLKKELSCLSSQTNDFSTTINRPKAQITDFSTNNNHLKSIISDCEVGFTITRDTDGEPIHFYKKWVTLNERGVEILHKVDLNGAELDVDEFLKYYLVEVKDGVSCDNEQNVHESEPEEMAGDPTIEDHAQQCVDSGPGEDVRSHSNDVIASGNNGQNLMPQNGSDIVGSDLAIVDHVQRSVDTRPEKDIRTQSNEVSASGKNGQNLVLQNSSKVLESNPTIGHHLDTGPEKAIRTHPKDICASSNNGQNLQSPISQQSVVVRPGEGIKVDSNGSTKRSISLSLILDQDVVAKPFEQEQTAIAEDGSFVSKRRKKPKNFGWSSKKNKKLKMFKK